MQHKSYRPQLKAAGSDGSASWVMATITTDPSRPVIDLDGDVTLPGAFGTQTFSIVPAHDETHVPLGKGVLREVDGKAVVDVKFNLDIQAARDWHSAIKFDLSTPPAVQEYSYAYSVRPGGARAGKVGSQVVRFLQPLPDGSPGIDVFESSPVLRGAAGRGRTMTLAAKSAGDDAMDADLLRVAMGHVADYHRERGDWQAEVEAIAARWGVA